MKCLLIAAAAILALLVAQPCSAQFAEGRPTATAPGPLANAKPDGPLGAAPYVIPQQAPTGGGIINLGQAFGDTLAPFINEAVNALVAAAMGWLFWLLKTKLNVNIDAEHRDALTAAAQRQASSLVADGKVALDGKTVKVDDKALFDAVNHLSAAAPDAIKRFGITPQALADRIVDMLPQVPAIAPAVAAAAVAGNGAAPLPPQQPEKPA